MKKFIVIQPIWIGDFFAEKGEVLELQDGYKLVSKKGKWVNKNYFIPNIQEITE